MTLNELKLVVAEIIEEAKKKKEKADDLKKKGKSVEAYGLYDEAFDFSSPLGAYNLYRQQGAANWGPFTSDGPRVDSQFHSFTTGATSMKEGEEKAIRHVVREVIENGLVPSDSAWAPLVENEQLASRRMSESPSWERATDLFEAWYDKFKKDKEEPKKSQSKGYEKTEYKLDKKSQERASGKKKK
jgi:hypothetical protein